MADYSGAPQCVKEYAGPIARGGEDLVEAWRKVNLASQSKNIDPQRLQRRFDEQNASPDRLKFALVETMSFGWWNCAIGEVQFASTNDTDKTLREFKKLFRKVRTLQCDGP